MTTEQLIGCPHEEGRDYPNGRAVRERDRQAADETFLITIAQEGT